MPKKPRNTAKSAPSKVPEASKAPGPNKPSALKVPIPSVSVPMLQATSNVTKSTATVPKRSTTAAVPVLNPTKVNKPGSVAATTSKATKPKAAAIIEPVKPLNIIKVPKPPALATVQAPTLPNSIHSAINKPFAAVPALNVPKAVTVLNPPKLTAPSAAPLPPFPANFPVPKYMLPTNPYPLEMISKCFRPVEDGSALRPATHITIRQANTTGLEVKCMTELEASLRSVRLGDISLTPRFGGGLWDDVSYRREAEKWSDRRWEKFEKDLRGGEIDENKEEYWNGG